MRGSAWGTLRAASPLAPPTRSAVQKRALQLGLAAVAIVIAACGSPGNPPAQDQETAATRVATQPGSDSALAVAIAAGEQQAASRLPPGAGREVVSEACLPCHDAAIIQMQRKPRDRWSRSVRRMVDWGAALSAEQEQVVVDYLVQHFGPEREVTP